MIAEDEQSTTAWCSGCRGCGGRYRRCRGRKKPVATRVWLGLRIFLHCAATCAMQMSWSPLSKYNDMAAGLKSTPPAPLSLPS